MISHEWLDGLGPDDRKHVEHLLSEAVAYDDEAGFSTAAPDRADRHLLVRMPPRGSRGSVELDALPDVELVAYLALRHADEEGEQRGDAWAQLVVRPEFRSLGVATLMLEQLRDEGETAFASLAGIGSLTSWAHGAHPAADRMCRRFGGSTVHEVWRTLRPVGGSRPYSAPRPEGVSESPETGPDSAGVVSGHDEAMAPQQQRARDLVTTRLQHTGGGAAVLGTDEESGTAYLGVIDAAGVADQQVRDLLVAGLLSCQEQGARVVELHVDAEVRALVKHSRELGFIHDQSDQQHVLALSG